MGIQLFFFRTVMDGVCDTNKCQCIPSIEIYAVNSRVLKCWVGLSFFFNLQKSGVNKFVTAVTNL